MLSLTCNESVFFSGDQGPQFTHKMEGLLLTQVFVIKAVMLGT